MPELIVRKWDGPYSFMIFREYGVYKARRGDTGEVQFEDPSKSVVIQNAINSLLQGGTIFLKEVQLPDGVTFGSNILIVEDYQGERKFYSNNEEYRSTEETASYIVFIEDGVVKAKNGHTGRVEFSNLDWSTVMQSVLNQLPAKVVIKPMDVTLTAPLEYPSYCIIDGCSPARVRLKSAFADYVFKPKVTTHKRFVQIRNLQILFESDKPGQGGVNLDGCSFSVLDNLYIARSADVATNDNLVGVLVTDDHGVGAYFNQFRNVTLEGLNKGYYYKPGTDGWFPNVNTIIGGRIRDCNVGWDIEAGVNNWMINTDVEGNPIGVQCNSDIYNGNAALGGHWDGNEIDIKILDNAGFTVLGAKWDLKVSYGTGSRLIHLGYPGPGHAGAVMKGWGESDIIRAFGLGDAAHENYIPISGVAEWSPSWRQHRVGRGGIFKNLYVHLNRAPGEGNSRTIRLFVDGAGTALSVTISGLETEGEDTAHTVKVDAGSYVSWQHRLSGTPDAVAETSIEVEFIHAQD